MAVKQPQLDPLEAGKGRIDEVDQSKGVFPAGVPHPPGAEPRMPASMGGGSYEESGRAGVELPGGAVAPGAPVAVRLSNTAVRPSRTPTNRLLARKLPLPFPVKLVYRHPHETSIARGRACGEGLCPHSRILRNSWNLRQSSHSSGKTNANRSRAARCRKRRNDALHASTYCCGF